MTAAADRRAQFVYSDATHTYTDVDGRVLPSITQMLERTGWVDARWFDEESSARGTAVHDLCEDYDRGLGDVATCASPYRPWLLVYAAATQFLRPEWDAIEEPAVHPTLRFGGRPDRVGRIFGAHAILEIKTLDKGWRLDKATPLQTALQALLASARYPLPASAWKRYALYLRPNGQFRPYEHTNRGDLDRAYEIVKQCCA